jgi:hypothetical protein
LNPHLHAPRQCIPPRRRFVRIGGYKKNCPVSTACGRNTLQIAGVQAYDSVTGAGYVKPSTTTATSDSTLSDYSGSHGPEQAIDSDPGTWFGSSGGEDQAWLQLDLGEGAPFVDQLLNVVIYQRQGAGACHEMLQCYSLDLLDADKQVGWARRGLGCWSRLSGTTTFEQH